MFNPSQFENSRPDGIPVLEIVSPEGGNAPAGFVPLRGSRLSGEVTGPLASLCLTQTYGYSREQCDRVLEAAYRFPLPGDAAVTGVRVRFGDVEIQAEVKEREAADAAYKEAKRAGRQAALATRESPDVFTLQVAGLQPDQDVTVETSYVQLARAEGPGWSLRVPLTTAPRYVRRDEAGSRHAEGQPLRVLRDPGHRFSLDLAFPAGGAVESATHPLAVTQEGEGLRVRLRDGEVLPDRDCVLTWRPPREADRPALQVLLHDDPAGAWVYFLALATPPSNTGAAPPVSREAILLVDHSGSMGGAKWDAADWAVQRFLAGLAPGDTLNLGLFHNTTRWFAPAPRPADPGTVEQALEFLAKNRDSGGTNLGLALEQALRQEREEPGGTGERSRHVLVITDAQVTDAGRILRLVEQEAKRADRRRVSVLCIDAAPNAFLAREIAGRGGGVARFLTSSPEEEDITTALEELLADWSAPVLAGMRLEVNRDRVEAAVRSTLPAAENGWGGIDLGDLPSGRPVWVAGRVPRGSGEDLGFRLMSGSRKAAACRVPLGGRTAARPALKALFGAGRVLGLEHLVHARYGPKELREQLARLGYTPGDSLQDPDGEPAVYAENARSDASKALKALLVREALDYGLASAETAFVAVRMEGGKPVEGTVTVANALPGGWSDEFVTRGGPGRARMACLMPAAAPPPPAAGAAYRLADAVADTAVEEEASAARVALGGPAPAGRAPAVLADDLDLPPFLRRSAGARKDREAVLFWGTPSFTGSEAVLFDSTTSQDAPKLPERALFSHLRVRFQSPAPRDRDPGLVLLLFVDDLAAPRARVRLADLLGQGGERPLNLRRAPGQAVRIVLQDPDGVWSGDPPRFEVAVCLG